MKKQESEILHLPASIGIILDGNGRWATARHLPRTAGHVAGAKNVVETMKRVRNYGIHTVTLYAFSTENWKRPGEEVDTIMELICRYLVDVVLKTPDRDYAVRFLGDKNRLPEKLRKVCTDVEESVKDAPFVCNVALNYGGRDEIVHAVKEALANGEEISEESISRHTYTAGLPDPDLIIRTGGEFRLSNFLLWQSAYSEIYVTKTLWPDFDGEELDRALRDFSARNRRFGGLDKNGSQKEENS